ncbi:hypothetical protein [Calidithermus chliarophilus]|uniref:hypothetical protein n=1 Tax=Calidithermus chliarophilus TaxID=52023 RepID=UPI0004148362|nr:hypothetical protein [Calidithermus chliarophilus]
MSLDLDTLHARFSALTGAQIARVSARTGISRNTLYQLKDRRRLERAKLATVLGALQALEGPQDPPPPASDPSGAGA